MDVGLKDWFEGPFDPSIIEQKGWLSNSILSSDELENITGLSLLPFSFRFFLFLFFDSGSFVPSFHFFSFVSFLSVTSLLKEKEKKMEQTKFQFSTTKR